MDKNSEGKRLALKVAPRLTVLKLDVARITLICLIAMALTWIASAYLLPGVDWQLTFRPASLALLSGKSPYSVEIFGLAPWGLLPMFPLALLPENWGRATLFLVSIVAFAFTAYRLGAKPLTLVTFLLSPPVVHSLLNANVDWMPLLGFILPPQLGLFFVTVKPQVGFGVALFWLAESWRKCGIREVVRVFGPISLAFLISFGVFGFWPIRSFYVFTSSHTWNASLWPTSIPVGLTLLVASIRTRQIKYAMAASPCLSPYVLFHAWAGALVSLASSNAEMMAAVIGLWVLVILRAFTGGL